MCFARKYKFFLWSFSTTQLILWQPRQNSPNNRRSCVWLMEILWINTLLENPGGKNCWSSKNFSLRSKCYVEKSLFLQKQRAFLKNTLRTCRLLFWETCWKKSLKFHFFLSASRNIPKHVFFPECMFFIEEFFTTTRMQLWLPSQKVSAKWPHVLLFTSWKNCRSKRFSKKFTRETFTDPLECSFKKPAPSFPAGRPITLGSSRTKTSV